MENEYLYKLWISVTDKKNEPISLNLYKFEIVSKKNAYWEIMFDSKWDKSKRRIKPEDFNQLKPSINDLSKYSCSVWLTNYNENIINDNIKEFLENIELFLNMKKNSIINIEDNLNNIDKLKIIDKND